MSTQEDDDYGVEPGNVCQLSSGGPRMTVEKITGGEVSCVWFDENDVLFRNKFPVEALTFEEEDDEDEDEDEEEDEDD